MFPADLSLAISFPLFPRFFLLVLYSSIPALGQAALSFLAQNTFFYQAHAGRVLLGLEALDLFCGSLLLSFRVRFQSRPRPRSQKISPCPWRPPCPTRSRLGVLHPSSPRAAWTGSNLLFFRPIRSVLFRLCLLESQNTLQDIVWVQNMLAL